MLFQIFITETLKYKRTIIPWLAAVGGFFPAMVALLYLLTGSADVTWEALWVTGFNFMNMLALLFTAVFMGHAFVRDYHGGANMLFIYPVPRPLLYAVKLLVALLPSLGMFGVFAALMTAAGWIFAGKPDPAFAAAVPGLLGLTAAAVLALAPLSAAVSVAARNAGGYILAGIGYFIVYMTFAGSDWSRYVPPCMPDRFVQDYLAAGRLLTADTGSMLAVCAAAFLAMSLLGAVGYVRREI